MYSINCLHKMQLLVHTTPYACDEFIILGYHLAESFARDVSMQTFYLRKCTWLQIFFWGCFRSGVRVWKRHFKYVCLSCDTRVPAYTWNGDRFCMTHNILFPRLSSTWWYQFGYTQRHIASPGNHSLMSACPLYILEAVASSTIPHHLLPVQGQHHFWMRAIQS